MSFCICASFYCSKQEYSTLETGFIPVLRFKKMWSNGLSWVGTFHIFTQGHREIEYPKWVHFRVPRLWQSPETQFICTIAPSVCVRMSTWNMGRAFIHFESLENWRKNAKSWGLCLMNSGGNAVHWNKKCIF